MNRPLPSRSRPVVAWLATCIVVVVAGCSGGANAATIGDAQITREALDRELEAIGENEKYLTHLERKAGFALRDGGGEFIPHLVAQVLTNKIRRVATAQMAEERGVKATKDEQRRGLITAQGAVGSPDTLQAFPRWYRNELIFYETGVIAMSRSLADLTPEQYYRRAKDGFVRACGRHIATQTREQAMAARRRIESGASFESVAQSVSLDERTSAKGGDLGCNPRGDLEGELDELAFSLRTGEVSQPVEVGGAFHLLMVSSRETPPLDRIRGEIAIAIRELGESKYESLLRETLISGQVSVARDVGVWDAAKFTVVPPLPDDPTPKPTPRPRPLPQVATSSNQVDPYFHSGQQVFITDDGFRPRDLVSIVQEEVTWINETDSPQTIRFLAGGRKVGPIEPGGRASYTPDATISIAYTLADDADVKGTVQVQWYFQPGEDPGAPDRLDADTPLPGTPTPWAPAE